MFHEILIKVNYFILIKIHEKKKMNCSLLGAMNEVKVRLKYRSSSDKFPRFVRNSQDMI